MLFRPCEGRPRSTASRIDARLRAAPGMSRSAAPSRAAPCAGTKGTETKAISHAEGFFDGRLDDNCSRLLATPRQHDVTLGEKTYGEERHANHRLHRCRKNRKRDHKASHQWRLSRARLPARLAGGVREDRRHPRAALRLTSARRPTSSFPACPAVIRSMTSSMDRTGLIHSARAARSSPSWARIRCRPRSGRSIGSPAKGAVFLDGEVSGTPGMVAQRKAPIYLAGDARRLQDARARHQVIRRHLSLFWSLRRGEQDQVRQQPAGHHQHGRHRRGRIAGAEGRRRPRFDDQGDHQRQRRIGPVPHPRAAHGAEELPARAGNVRDAVPLFRLSSRTLPTGPARRRRCSISRQSSTGAASSAASPSTMSRPSSRSSGTRVAGNVATRRSLESQQIPQSLSVDNE